MDNPAFISEEQSAEHSSNGYTQPVSTADGVEDTPRDQEQYQQQLSDLPPPYSPSTHTARTTDTASTTNRITPSVPENTDTSSGTRIRTTEYTVNGVTDSSSTTDLAVGAGDLGDAGDSPPAYSPPPVRPACTISTIGREDSEEVPPPYAPTSTPPGYQPPDQGIQEFVRQQKNKSDIHPSFLPNYNIADIQIEDAFASPEERRQRTSSESGGIDNPVVLQAATASVTSVQITSGNRPSAQTTTVPVVTQPGPTNNTAAPAVPTFGAQQRDPASYMFISVLACLFCNLITGTIAIVLSHLTDKANKSGDRDKAVKLSRGALVCVFLSLPLGIATLILVLMLAV